MSSINRIVRACKLRSRNLSSLRAHVRHSSSEEDFMRSPFVDIKIPNINVVDFVTKDFGKRPNKVAVECGITGRRYTYDDLRVKSQNLAKSLRHIFKLQKGDVIAIVLPNVPEYPLCQLGCLSAGITITTVNPMYTPDEMQRQLLDSNVKAIITFGGSISTVNAAIFKMRRKIPIIAVKTQSSESLPEGTVDFHELLNTNLFVPNLSPIDNEDVAVIPYSSGTTGLPKGVEITNRNLVSNILQINHDAEPEREHDILPCILPMFHIYGFNNQTLATLQMGVKLVTLPKFTPKQYLKTIIDHKATALMVAPPVVLFLNAHPAVTRQHLQHLRLVVCGAAPLSSADEFKLKEKAGKPIAILQGYGLTETSPLVLEVRNGMQKDGGMGYVTHNTFVKVVKINDPNIKHLGPHEVGELLVRGPQVMKGYHKRPKDTEAAFINGWLRTGDLVRYDEDGMFYIADRIKELIKVKGFQVPPAELEEIIRKFPGVAEAAVIGVPHERFGEVPRAYVVPKSGETVDSKKLIQFVKSNVAPYKELAGGVSVIDAVPKNPSGKILRRELKTLYENKGV